MVMLCFLLDLCGLPAPLLGNLKQCLLQLANFYAISSTSRHQAESLRDNIGVCYLLKKRISCSYELKVAYCPRRNFSLRDFHHAVNNLPTDEFLPEINDSGALGPREVPLLNILSDQGLYSWGGKDIMRKVIVLSSCLPENIMDNAMRKKLMDAADKCVSVEFVMFEQSSSHLGNMQENINSFLRSLSDLDNCSFRTYLPETGAFHGLVKRWLQDLKDEMEEPLQAHFIFNVDLVGSLNQISCSLSTSVDQIIDGFTTCQTCKCHGTLIDVAAKDKNKRLSCSVTDHDLVPSDVIEDSVKIGEGTVLFVPYCKTTFKLQQVSSPINFNVIERTNLRNLCEGVMMGPSYFVTPSAGQDELETSSGEIDPSELNAQIFQGICRTLHSMDEGLVCSSCCNLETMREAAFSCYYVLQPSNDGPMLLRRLAGLEEVLLIPDVHRFVDSSVNKEIQNTIQASLLKIELRDYNPVLHERGFHQKLTLLVKESLQFGSIPLQPEDITSAQNSNQPDSSAVIVTDAIAVEEDTPKLDLKATEDKTTASIAEEWEQLVVTEVLTLYSPTCNSKPKANQSTLTSPDSDRQLDAKTSRILERLEVPRQLRKIASPTVKSSSLSESCVPAKLPLVPFQPTQALTSGQLMKPNFVRLKRKYK